MNNSKKSIYNILFGLLSQLITIVAGVIFPRLILINLGSEINGLTNSVNQIFVYFSLLEAGVGTASLQALYGPVGRMEYDSINGILAATDRYYKRTGCIYVISFVGLSILYPLLVDSTLPRSTIFWVIIFTGLSGVISYFFQGKYNILLLAEGKNYINSNLGSIVYIITSILKLWLLISGYGIVAIQGMYCAFNFVKMLYIEWYMRTKYKWINLKVNPNIGAISQSKFAFIHQLSSLIFNNTDIIILTFFVGLKSVSVYSMYTLLFGMIGTAIATITSSVQFALGQVFDNNRKKYIEYHDAYEVFSMVVCFSLYCVANIFILPFMKLYTSGVDDIVYVDKYLPYLFVIVFLISNARESSNITIKYAGHFKQTVSRTIIESTINIIVSILCVWKFGIYGVLFGTIVALLYRANDMIIYSSKRILEISPWKTYRRWCRNLLVFVLITVVAKNISMDLSSYFDIICYACATALVCVSSFVIVNMLFEKKVLNILVHILFHKFKKSN